MGDAILSASPLFSDGSEAPAVPLQAAITKASLVFSLFIWSPAAPPSLNTTTVTITTQDINKMRQDLFFHFVPLTTHCAWLIGSSRLFSLSCHSWTNGVSVTPARRLDVAVTRPASWVSLSRHTAYWALQTAGSARKRGLTNVLCLHAWKRFESWINFTNSNSSIRGRLLFFFLFFLLHNYKLRAIISIRKSAQFVCFTALEICESITVISAVISVKQQGEQSFEATLSPIWDLTNPCVSLRLYVKYAAGA